MRPSTRPKLPPATRTSVPAVAERLLGPQVDHAARVELAVEDGRRSLQDLDPIGIRVEELAELRDLHAVAAEVAVAVRVESARSEGCVLPVDRTRLDEAAHVLDDVVEADCGLLLDDGPGHKADRLGRREDLGLGLRGHTGTGRAHGQSVHPERIDFELDLDLRDTGTDGDGHRGRLVSESGNHEGPGSLRHAVDREAPVGIRRRSPVRRLDPHARRQYRIAGVGGPHGPADGPGLLHGPFRDGDR